MLCLSHLTSISTETQIKTTVNYHFTPVRMTVVKTNAQHAGSAGEQAEPCALLVGVKVGAATVENSAEISVHFQTIFLEPLKTFFPTWNQ